MEEGDGPSGLALLADFDGPAWEPYGETGVSLWVAYRAVRDHLAAPRVGPADSDPGSTPDRGRFAEARAAAPELAPAWDAFAALLGDPAAMEPRRLAEACHAVYAWAERRSLIRTARRFAETAALLDDEDPALADDAGWACRRAGKHEASGEWHRRAFVLARLSRNHPEAIRALIGQAALEKDRGRTAVARARLEEAVRRGQWTRQRRLATQAQHHLFALLAEDGTFAEALEALVHALEMYPVFAPRFPALAHDFGFLLVRHRLYTSAVLVLQRLENVVFTPNEQMLLAGTLAHAAAGMGRRDVFEEAEKRVWRLAEAVEEPVPAAWIRLAEGARHLGRWDSAQRYAETGANSVRRQGDAILARIAGTLLSQLAVRTPAPREAAPPDPETLRSLVSRFGYRLRRWTDGETARRRASRHDGGWPA